MSSCPNWQLMIYKIPSTIVESFRGKISFFLRRWLSLPRSIRSVTHYGQNTKLQLPVSSLTDMFKGLNHTSVSQVSQCWCPSKPLQLFTWGLRDSPACQFYQKRSFSEHNLSSCHRPLERGGFVGTISKFSAPELDMILIGIKSSEQQLQSKHGGRVAFS